jgi:hypothetical protein
VKSTRLRSENVKHVIARPVVLQARGRRLSTMKFVILAGRCIYGVSFVFTEFDKFLVLWCSTVVHLVVQTVALRRRDEKESHFTGMTMLFIIHC